MNKTGIEWTDYTWNPVTGCTKVSPGCDRCYAEALTIRFKRGTFSEVRLHPDRLNEPLLEEEPAKIFVCSMSDLFHSAVPWHFICKVFETMRRADHHTFQVLTKRPGRMAFFANTVWPAYTNCHPIGPWDWPPNVWAMTSVESQKYAPRINVLSRVPAKVRGVSYEPALGPVDFRPWLFPAHPQWYRESDGRILSDGPRAALDWLVAGGESGPGARPADPDWFRSAREQCEAAGVPFFFKQWGGAAKKAAGAVLDGREWREFPA